MGTRPATPMGIPKGSPMAVPIGSRSMIMAMGTGMLTAVSVATQPGPGRNSVYSSRPRRSGSGWRTDWPSPARSA